MIDGNQLREEFGRYLAEHKATRWGMDAALMHVCKIAYDAGKADGPGEHRNGAAETLDKLLSEHMKRSVKVEQILLDIASGRRPMLTPDECRTLSLALGTPYEAQTDAQQAMLADAAHIQRGAAPEGWKEATIAWEVCASIHREYAKKKDPFFTTRQADFVKHTEAARSALLAAAPDQFRDAAKMVADTEDNGFDLLHDRPHAEMPGCRGAKSLKVRAPAEVPSVDQLWNNDEVMALNAELGLTMDQLSRLASAITRITHPAAPPADWRERFSQAVYDDLAAADNQDVPLEEYPARILKVLDAVIGREMNPAPAEVPMPEPVAYGFGNTAITGHTNRLMMVRLDVPFDDQYAGAFWLPLVLADEARTYGERCRAAGEAAGYARGLAAKGGA